MAAADHILTFDGSAEKDGSFALIGGAGSDSLTGGAGNDSFDLTKGGDDTVVGAGMALTAMPCPKARGARAKMRRRGRVFMGGRVDT
ncbi:hypothetical protein WCLP8_4690018 [uncultured Gammaproteobacteria bacterium]